MNRLIILLLSIISLSSCKKDEVYTYKGTHISFPIPIKRVKIDSLSFYVDFHDAKYILKDSIEQYDWNKLTGVKFNFFKPHENTIMVGWRYNRVIDSFQLTMYFHQNNKVQTVQSSLINLQQKAFFSIILNETEKAATVVFENEKGEKRFRTIDWQEFGKKWLVDSWFGGTLPAPRKINFTLKRMNFKPMLITTCTVIINPKPYKPINPP